MEKDRMTVGAFNDPEPSLEAYRLLRESGINTVFVNRKKTKEQMLDILSFADTLGLSVIVDIMDHPSFFLDEDILSHPSFSGYHVHDEPKAQDFGKIRDMAVLFNGRFKKEKLFFVNLCTDQWDSNLQKLGFPSYRSYVEAHVRNALLPLEGRRVLSVDSYPLMYDYSGQSECLDNRHLEVLETIAESARDHGLETHLYLQAMGYGKFHRKPDLDGMRFQFNTGFAYGFRFFTHFCYYTPGGPSSTEFNPEKDTAMVLKNGDPTDTYYAVRDAKAEAQIIYKVLRDMAWKHTSFIDGRNPSSEYKGKEYLVEGRREISGIERLEASHEAILSEFGNGGKPAYMAVNFTDPFRKLGNEIQVFFREETSVSVHMAGRLAGKRMDVFLQKGEPLKILLAPGEGAVITVK